MIVRGEGDSNYDKVRWYRALALLAMGQLSQVLPLLRELAAEEAFFVHEMAGELARQIKAFRE